MISAFSSSSPDSPEKSLYTWKKVAFAVAIGTIALSAFHFLEKTFFAEAAPLNDREIEPCITGISQALVQAKGWSVPIKVLASPLLASEFTEKAVKWVAHYCSLLSWKASSLDLEAQLKNTVKVFNKHISKGLQYIAVVTGKKRVFSRALCTSLKHLPTEVVTKEGIIEALKRYPTITRIAIFADPFENFSEELSKALGGLNYLKQLKRIREYRVSIVSLLLPELDPSILHEKHLLIAPHDQKPFFDREYVPTEKQNEQILADITEKWRPFVQWNDRASSLRAQLENFANSKRNGTYVIGAKQLVPRSLDPKTAYFFRKAGTTFFLSDSLVVKPLQGDCLVTGNPYSPNLTSYVKRRYPNFPPYQDVFRRVVTSKIARLAGMDSIVPRAELAIIKTKHFGERLCAVEEYIPNAKTLAEAKGEILHGRKRFNPTTMKKYLFFSYLIHNSDMNQVNSLIRFVENTIHFVSVDHDATFPSKNRNFKLYFDNFVPLSQKITDEDVKMIKNFPIEGSCQVLKDYGLENTIAAFKDRASALKKWTYPGMTLSEVYEKMSS